MPKGTTTDLARRNSDFPYSLACLACSKHHSSDTMSVFHGNLHRRSS
jgi:hypothetical protein